MGIRLPRDLTGRDLALLLRAFGYEVTRNTLPMRSTNKADSPSPAYQTPQPHRKLP